MDGQTVMNLAVRKDVDELRGEMVAAVTILKHQRRV